jgi:hypothetical protein
MIPPNVKAPSHRSNIEKQEHNSLTHCINSATLLIVPTGEEFLKSCSHKAHLRPLTASGHTGKKLSIQLMQE